MRFTTENYCGTVSHVCLPDAVRVQDNVVLSVVGRSQDRKGNGIMWTIARTDYDSHGEQVGCDITTDAESDTAIGALDAAITAYRRAVPKASMQMVTDHEVRMISFSGRNVASYSTLRVGGAR